MNYIPTRNNSSLPDLSNSNLDLSKLRELGRLGKAGSPQSKEALLKAAKQFEALFMQQVIKSMRQANIGESMLDSSQSKLFQSLQDEQLASKIVEQKGFGLAEMIVKQIQQREKAAAEGGEIKPAALHPFDAKNYLRKPLK